MIGLNKVAWTAWALVPVAAVAFHFGPGQELAARDLARQRLQAATQAERSASEAQDRAYELHLETIEARRVAFLGDDPAANAALEAAIETETRAYEDAADAWERAADAFQQVEDLIAEQPGADVDRIRWAKSRALVRSGDIWGGATELEGLLYELDAQGEGDTQLAHIAREELGCAHYFGARLLRLAGEPASEWRPEAVKARQHFRYLAEQAADDGEAEGMIRGLEDNVERVLDLEAQDKSEVEGSPLPRRSPRATRGNRPGNSNRAGKSRRPPQQRDGRGAGGAGAIGRGW